MSIRTSSHPDAIVEDVDTSPSLRQPSMLDAVASELGLRLALTPAQVSLIRALERRRTPALVETLRQLAQRRATLLSLLTSSIRLSGPGAGSGDIRTATRAVEACRLAVLTTVCSTGREILGTLDGEQRRRVDTFDPPLVPDHTLRAASHRLVQSIDRLSACGDGAEDLRSLIADAADAAADTVAALCFPPPLQSSGRAIAESHVSFWAVPELLWPEGVLRPRIVRRAAVILGGTDEAAGTWSNLNGGLARTLESPVLASDDGPRAFLRIATALMCLVLASHPQHP